MAHVYFHIDLNAFFASAECLVDPGLKGKPIAVAGQTRRSVVSTASYEARKYGVHSAMPIAMAKQLCRDLIIVEPHFNLYRELSDEFMAIVRSYTPLVEQASIDECYADMTEPIRHFEKPLDLAWQLQHRILNEVGIPCSIGVAPNMFLAKMGSDRKKPMGITVMRIREVPQKLWPLPISEMRGVGNKTLPLMEDLDIHTIGDLANYKDKEKLKQVFGKNTDLMIARANGHDDRTIVTESDAKSMGVSETLLEDVTDYDEIRGMFRYLSRKLSKRLYASKKAGFTVSIQIKYYDFTNTDRSIRLDHAIWSADDLFVQAMSLFDANWEDDPVRLLGLSVSDFTGEAAGGRQIDLFNQPDDQQLETAHVLKDLNNELGSHKFIKASDLLKEKS